MSRRTLTPEERELWNAVAKQAKPLRKRAKKIEKPSSIEPLAVPAPRVAAASKAAASKAVAPKPRAPPQPPALAHFDRRERAKIAKGKREIDARIDLHGMTQARAHRALLAFLHREGADGSRVVLVITGKGKEISKATPADAPRGVLRRMVPEWLALPEFRALVVSYEQAAIGHGGEGALYVRIRRG